MEIGKLFLTVIIIIGLISVSFFPLVMGRSYEKIGLSKDKVGLNKIFKNSLNPVKLDFIDLFKSKLYTKCGEVEKSNEIIFYLYSDIDVDDNLDTGVNGADIRVQYLLLPWIEFDPSLGIGVIFTINIERIGQEIKDKDFHVYLGVGNNKIRFGYNVEKQTGNEVPDSTRLSFKVLYYLYEGTLGFTVNFNPQYSTGEDGKKIELFTELNDDDIQRNFSFDFDPAVETQIIISSTKKEGEWNYVFDRVSSTDCKVNTTIKTVKNGEEKETNIIVDKLPKKLGFLLALTPLTAGGGSFLYESEEMYNIEVLISSNQMGDLIYATVINTPLRLFAEWTPTFLNGDYHLEVNSTGTDFILQDFLTSPNKILKIMNLTTINLDANWNLTNPGDFTVKKNTDLEVDLDFIIGEWQAKTVAQPVADYISTSWYINVTGYIMIDTNWESFNSIDFMIVGGDSGLRIIGETFKSEDFVLGWTIWPPVEWNLDVSGDYDFISIAIDVKLGGSWYHLWPF